MRKFLLRKMRLSGKGLFLVIGLALMALVITAVRIFSVLEYQVDLARAGIDFRLDTLLQLWVGYTESFNLTGSGFMAIAADFSGDVFSKIAMPFLVAFSGVDYFLNDFHSDMHPIIYSRINRTEYYGKQALFVFEIAFLMEAWFLLVQLGMSFAGVQLLENRLLAGRPNALDTIGAAAAILRLSLYYALLAGVAYTLSTFFVKNRMGVYIVPVIVCLGSSIICLGQFQNDPLALAYIDSGLAAPKMGIYLGFCLAAAMLVLIGNGSRMKLSRSDRLPEKWDEILLDTE